MHTLKRFFLQNTSFFWIGVLKKFLNFIFNFLWLSSYSSEKGHIWIFVIISLVKIYFLHAIFIILLCQNKNIVGLCDFSSTYSIWMLWKTNFMQLILIIYIDDIDVFLTFKISIAEIWPFDRKTIDCFKSEIRKQWIDYFHLIITHLWVFSSIIINFIILSFIIKSELYGIKNKALIMTCEQFDISLLSLKI
jgi:hypothetical protein